MLMKAFDDSLSEKEHLRLQDEGRSLAKRLDMIVIQFNSQYSACVFQM